MNTQRMNTQRINSQRVEALRWAGAAAATAAALSLVVGGTVVWATGSEVSPTTTSTAVTPTTDAVTGPVREEASLVAPERSGVLFRWNGVEVTAEELLALDAADVPADVPLLVDSGFVAAHRESDVDLGRLQAQLRHLAQRLLPVALGGDVDPDGPGTFEVAVVAPPTQDGEAIDVPVMVFNTADLDRRIAALDLRILGVDGAPATERVRFFEDRTVVVPAHSAYFNALTFVGDQVTRPRAVRRSWSFEATVSWAVPPGEEPTSG